MACGIYHEKKPFRKIIFKGKEESKIKVLSPLCYRLYEDKCFRLNSSVWICLPNTFDMWCIEFHPVLKNFPRIRLQINGTQTSNVFSRTRAVFTQFTYQKCDGTIIYNTNSLGLFGFCGYPGIQGITNSYDKYHL